MEMVPGKMHNFHMVLQIMGSRSAFIICGGFLLVLEGFFENNCFNLKFNQRDLRDVKLNCFFLENV